LSEDRIREFDERRWLLRVHPLPDALECIINLGSIGATAGESLKASTRCGRNTSAKSF
jgi:hypothetical protein